MSKIIVDKVEKGVVPYGPGLGDPIVAIHFKQVDGEYDYEMPELKDEEGNARELTAEEKAANGLVKDTLEKIAEAKLDKDWTQYLFGRRYVYFVGDCLADDENKDVAQGYFTLLAATARALQFNLATKKEYKGEASIAALSEEERSELRKIIKAPSNVFVGHPKFYTGRRTFYENFNVCIVDMNGTEDEINPMACVELGNHVFSAFCIKGDSADVKKTIEDLEAKKCITTPPLRTFIVDTADKYSEEVAEVAMEKGFRLNKALKYKSGVLSI